jgi:hypothetical protein
MVRRRQPYSSALFVLQAGSQDSVDASMVFGIDLPGRALLLQFGDLELIDDNWTPLEWYQLPIGIFGHLCVSPALFSSCGVLFSPPRHTALHKPRSATPRTTQSLLHHIPPCRRTSELNL